MTARLFAAVALALALVSAGAHAGQVEHRCPAKSTKQNPAELKACAQKVCASVTTGWTQS